MKKRIISLILALLMILTLLPVTAFAESEECWHCGHRHWGDYICSGCGACSLEDSNVDCFVETHCNECGACLMNNDGFCTECNYCPSCMEGSHCVDCHACYIADEDGNICGNCWRCKDCVSICPDCGMCDECVESDDNMHCPICNNCYQTTGQCASGGNHCEFCCLLCAEDDKCVTEDSVELCEYCDMCPEHCRQNAENAGGDGSICIESDEWQEHVCEECQEYKDDGDLCSTCGDAGVTRCKDCCASASECSLGMCEYDTEYQDHFCEACGQCFDDVDQSTTMDELCTECYAEYLKAEEHTHKESKYMGRNDTQHWNICCFCEDYQFNVTDHDFSENGVCKSCGYTKGGYAPFITRQPRDVTVNAPLNDAYTEDETNGLLHKQTATFKIAAKGGIGELHYQWYNAYDDMPLTEYDTAEVTDDYATFGTNTNTLTMNAPEDICEGPYNYYCMVTDDAGQSTKSAVVSLKGRHIYSETIAKNMAAAKPAKAVYPVVTMSYIKDGKTYTVTSQASDGHRYPCLSKKDGHYKSEKPVLHEFDSGAPLGRSAKAGATVFDTVYEKTCKTCGYKTYTVSHQCKFYDSATGKIAISEAQTTRMAHALKCLVEGCDRVRMESHEWKWYNNGYGNDTESGGSYYRECAVCGYHDEDYGDKWTSENALVKTDHAQASKTVVSRGETLTLTLNDNRGTPTGACTGWKVTYTAPNGHIYDLTTMYRNYFDTDPEVYGMWTCQVKSFGVDAPGGGILHFEPVFDNTITELTTVKGTIRNLSAGYGMNEVYIEPYEAQQYDLKIYAIYKTEMSSAIEVYGPHASTYYDVETDENEHFEYRFFVEVIPRPGYSFDYSRGTVELSWKGIYQDDRSAKMMLYTGQESFSNISVPSGRYLYADIGNIPLSSYSGDLNLTFKGPVQGGETPLKLLSSNLPSYLKFEGVSWEWKEKGASSETYANWRRGTAIFPAETVAGVTCYVFLSKKDLNMAASRLTCYINGQKAELKPYDVYGNFALIPTGKLLAEMDKEGSGPWDWEYLIYEVTFNSVPAGVLGDVNLDKKCNVLDVQALYGYLTSGKPPAAGRSGCDLNGDGSVDVYDLQYLYELVSKMRTA